MDYQWKSSQYLLLLMFILMTCPPVLAFLEGLYCGRENCYDVLGLTREASKADVAKAYRRLAKLYHPDMHKSQEDKKKNEEKFMLVAVAYETLRDDDARKEYDDMLDNPEQVYRHYYYYYRRKVAPKVDVRLVIAVTITVISVVQYYSAWSNYHSALSYLSTVPKYRMQAMQIAKEEGLIDPSNKKRNRRNKEEVKEEEDAVIKQVIAERMDIRGGYSKPSVYNILWLQLIFLPYYILLYIMWYVRWVYKFTVMREEYGDEEKYYVIRRYMKMNQGQWDAVEDKDKEKYLKLQLWIKAKFVAWKKEQEEEMKRKLAENPRYRSYRRMMKNNPPGQMTFMED